MYPTATIDPTSNDLFSATTPHPHMRRGESISMAQSPLSPPPTATNDADARTDAFARRASTVGPTTAAAASSSTTSTAAASVRSSGSLGVGFLTLEYAHRLESVHDAPVTCLHSSAADWKKLWSGDRSGRVQAWQISSDEHWLKDAEAKNCQACQVKFSVLERRHRQDTRDATRGGQHKEWVTHDNALTFPPVLVVSFSSSSDCRECGLVYCSKCSSHRTPLEHLGFSQSVRVCDACFAKVASPQGTPNSMHSRSYSIFNANSGNNSVK